jgi:hypothetical protein
VGLRAVLNKVVKRKIPSPRRESNPRTPIVQPYVARMQEVRNSFKILVGRSEQKRQRDIGYTGT